MENLAPQNEKKEEGHTWRHSLSNLLKDETTVWSQRVCLNDTHPAELAI